MRYGAFALTRVCAIVLSALTSAYGLLNCSPFAFDMFVRPQLFPWLGQFVAWHHLWVAAMWAATSLTLLPQLWPGVRREGASRVAHVLAAIYVAGGGLFAILLFADPLLPALWGDGDGRARVVALLAWVPLIWLAAIDHTVAFRERTPSGRQAPDPKALDAVLAGAAATAIYLWLTHAVRMLAYGHGEVDLPTAMSAVWALVLVGAGSAVVCLVLMTIAAVAARTAAPAAVEHALIVCAAGVAAAEFLRRAILPSVGVPALDAGFVAAAAGGALAATWSGLALRAAAERHTARSPWDVLLVSGAVPTPVRLTAAIGVTLVSFAALHATQRLDWNFVGQRAIAVLEGAAMFAILAGLALRRPSVHVPCPIKLAAPYAALAALCAAPPAAAAAAAWMDDRRLEPAAFERRIASDVTFQLLADAFVARAPVDPAYHRFLQVHATAPDALRAPEIDLAAAAPATGDAFTPDIHLFVVDSLRRDYLSPYNAAVRFTPHIGRFAEESFVFQNAFTRHGGTELAMASIWSGTSAVRTIRARQFHRMNVLEKLVNARGYRVAINDFTIAEQLGPATPVTRIDPDVPSVDTDLCGNLESLRAYLTASAADRRPVFSFFAPMNVHILNTRQEDRTTAGGRHPGFYAPYAARLERLDACFGTFISWLRETGRYDRSIVILTSDHGDSLGENGYWGHAMWLFPEIVRIPLIVRMPESLSQVVTTDLAQVAFSSDIAPTLSALLGYRVGPTGTPVGEPLFAAPDAVLPDRRRQAFLLTSSYGATYGLLRNNGRFLYVSDLVEWREFAFDLSEGPLGTPIVVDAPLRRVNQARIRREVTDLEAFYGIVRSGP